MSRDRSLFLGCFVLGIAVGAGVALWWRGPQIQLPNGEEAERADVVFNQQILEAVRSSSVDLNEPLAVFAHVFARLPERVQVYPTENYYYFTLWSGGQEVHGNLRLDTADRDDGILSFGYFGQHGNPEHRDDLNYLSHFKELNTRDGVEVKKLGALEYAVTFGGKRVVFALHDVPQTVPPGFRLQPSERFMARTFDESGWQLVLLYDQERPAFRFALDETAPLPDVLTEIAHNVFVGRLSGFAFYKDQLGKHLLFGVNTHNVRLNTYFDGPFDQLADNFVVGTTLQEALEAVYPSAQGRIDERGIFVNKDGERLTSRLALTPYVTYSSVTELRQHIDRCAQQSGGVDIEMTRCLTADYKQSSTR